MTALFTLFWRICTFKNGPETIPANSLILGLVLVLNAITNLVGRMILDTLTLRSLSQTNPEIVSAENLEELSLMTTVTQVVVGLAATAGLVWLVLTLMNFGQRFPRTICALLGVDVLLTVISCAAMALGLAVHPQVGNLIYLGLVFWSIAVFGFIFHRALEISMGFGVAAAIFVMLFSVAISQVAIGV